MMEEYKMRKSIKSTLKKVLVTSSLFMFLFSSQVFATVTEADVLAEITSRFFIIDMLKIILLFVAVIGVGFEFILNRKKEEERSKTLESVPYVIGGVVIIVFGLQLVTMLI